MAQRKFIRTSRYELWRRLRLGAWLIFAVNLFRAWSAESDILEPALADSPGGPRTLLAVALVILLVGLLTSFFPMFLWWCVCTLLMSRSRREASFSPQRDLEYYRERLGGVSAVQVSLLADLRVEPREDAAATLLSLALRGVIGLDGDGPHIRDAEAVRALPRGDRLLVRLAMANGLDATTYHEWARVAEEEAIDGWLLLRKEGNGTPSAHFLRGCGFGCLTLVITVMLFEALNLMWGDIVDIFDAVGNDYELVTVALERPALMVVTVAVVLMGLAVAAAYALPLIGLARDLVENGDASRRIERTQKGEETAECVYGIRNYLRDFTALSEADRGALAIWDDFLVYAVALGENRKVVRDLLGMRGISADLIGM